VGAILTGAGRAAPPAALAWFVWGLAAALYLIAFYQRVAPAVITNELASEFALTAAALGNLSAFYFYSYVAVQIPTGLLADRWGPRRVLAAGGVLTAAGTLVFALAPNVEVASLGRFAIGAAAGVAFVSMLKLASHWMPPRQFAFASGLALFVGTLGATLAGAPLRIAVDAFAWRGVMVASAAFTALVAVAIWIVVRDDPSERGYASYFPEEEREGDIASVGAHLREVLRYRNAWVALAAPGATTGIVLTFAGLWGVPYLVSRHGFAPREAAMTTSAMLIAWAVGGLAFGEISQRVGLRKAPMIAGLAATLAVWVIVVFVPGIEGAVLVALLLVLAFIGGTVVLVFAFAKESVPRHLGGTVSGVANMGMMMGGMVMQPAVGFMLDRHWTGAMAGGARLYDDAAYRWGFSLMLAWAVVALVVLARARETHCKPLA
jgi:predicted MFS family arabinose efflux permease